MINYSIFPAEMVFKDWDNFEPQYETIKVSKGISIEVEKLDNKRVKISKMVCSDPQKYLNTKYSPGTILNLSLNVLQKT